MKKIIFGILVGFLVVFSSCQDDDEGYSLGNYWVGFGIVDETEGSNNIILDNGEVLVPLAYEHMHSDLEQLYDENHDPIDNGDRVLVNFTILDDKKNDAGEVELYYVKINSIRNILMKGILDITEENADSIGSDPVFIEDAWISGDLLNIKFRYWGLTEMHYINLVKAPGELTADSQPVALEFRHNANGDSEDIPFVAYVSFQLDEIEIAGLDSVEFTVTATDYEGEVFEYEGVYTYGENN